MNIKICNKNNILTFGNLEDNLKKYLLKKILEDKRVHSFDKKDNGIKIKFKGGENLQKFLKDLIEKNILNLGEIILEFEQGL